LRRGKRDDSILAEWLFDDVFQFHSNYIAEFLNEIRWAIFECLPEYRRSWHPKDGFEGDYGYHVPAAICDPFAEAMYWDLMNRVRRRPYFGRFQADESFKRPHRTERATVEES